MASALTWKRAAAVVVSSCLAACSLTLDLAHIPDARAPRDASGTGDARFDATLEDTHSEDGLPEDTSRLDVPAVDAPPPDRVAIDVRPNDVDTRSCVTGTACPPDQTCCEASGQCYPSACLSCCMFAVEAGVSDGGAADVARPDVGAPDVPRPDAGVSDVGVDAMRDVIPVVDVPAPDVGFGCVPGCATGQTCCAGMCVDLNVNEFHCGGCFLTCSTASPVCIRGGCTACGTNRPCRDPAGQVCCTASPTGPCPSMCPLGG